MNKLWLFKQVIFTAVMVLLLWDVAFWLIGQHRAVPESHRQWLLAGALLWITSVLADKNSDDDWAGQF